jgi:colicin import membrane protein
MSSPIGRPGVTYAEVAAAADRITARSERATVRAVRAELGGTGSLETIQREFSAWKERNRPAKAESVTLPVDLQRVLLGHIERAAADARADLQTELADTQAEREALTDELERQSRGRAEAEQRAEELLAEVARLRGALDQAEGREEARERALQEAREAAESARKAEALATLRLESLPTLQSENAALKAKLDEVNEARRVAEIEAAELRGPGGKKT